MLTATIETTTTPSSTSRRRCLWRQNVQTAGIATASANTMAMYFVPSAPPAASPASRNQRRVRPSTTARHQAENASVVISAKATSFSGAVIWLLTPGVNTTAAPAIQAQGRPTIGVASTTADNPSNTPNPQWTSCAVTPPSMASPHRYHISTSNGKVEFSL